MPSSISPVTDVVPPVRIAEMLHDAHKPVRSPRRPLAYPSRCPRPTRGERGYVKDRGEAHGCAVLPKACQSGQHSPEVEGEDGRGASNRKLLDNPPCAPLPDDLSAPRDSQPERERERERECVCVCVCV
jgi:hypothetical protein